VAADAAAAAAAAIVSDSAPSISQPTALGHDEDLTWPFAWNRQKYKLKLIFCSDQASRQ
jgi:hypothetical protein